jgi:NAD(P)-dependent dehydrogenase (short-subunit alcohol dehydrogenase family)
MPYGFFLSGRHGLTDDAGYIAAFLAADASRFITGASIRADGGCLMAYY